MVWFVVPVSDQLFYVVDVPDNFRTGAEGAGSEYKDWRVAAGDGDCGRSGADADHGMGCGGSPRNCALVRGATGRLCDHRHLFVLGIEAARACGGLNIDMNSGRRAKGAQG